ncbi:MAG: dihydrodipicolinate synthase family protein [Rhodospirillaceae bacterium]|nr:dihydrodipicolinate synthase family protein [Rhodospirillaceae bacterium]MBT6305326.1 dihydrodipicolinate synthase family protein [Rhodospirillaceae bacterium]
MTIQMPFEPRGVIPACLLPFDSEMNIDETNFRSHLRDLVSVDGLSAITINAHSMEVHALSIEEQARTTDITLDEIGDQIPVVHGVYADGSENAATIARQAESKGARCLLVFPPNTLAMGGQMRPEMAIRHFETIAAATTLPIILFQYPLGPGLGYPIDTLLEICQKVPQIRAIKDWCNDPALHERHIRELRSLTKPVNILSTHSAWLLSSLVQGCDGLLSGAGSVIANLQVALFRAFKNGDLNEAYRINEMIYPTVRAFYDAPFLDMHNRMKEALHYLGRLPPAHVRPPLMKLTQEEITKIEKCMDTAGLTPENVYQKVA